MTGAALSRHYYMEYGKPMLEAEFPFLLDQIAIGRVGEGSECFGLDDALSQDHDFGPGFCLWLNDRLFWEYGAALSRAYWDLPLSVSGVIRPKAGPFLDRVGIFSIKGFYARFLGSDGLPQTEEKWFSLPQEVLALCTNGEVYADPADEFSSIRRQLLSYYPEQVRLKKLAAHCAIAAQAGQYNYPRSIRRSDHCAAIWAIQQFLYHYQAAVFLLNHHYQPYGKLAHRALCRLPILGWEAGPLLSQLAPGGPQTERLIEDACILLADELRKKELSCESGNFLLTHGAAIHARLTSPSLRHLPLMSWKTGWQFN